MLGGIAIELLRSRGGAAGDQALALVFYTGIALGVVLVAQAGALNVDLFQYLFGSILTVTRGDLALIAALGAVGLATIALLYRAFAAVVIDEEGARVAGVPIGSLNVALAALAAVTVALSMRVVGILLVAALMVLPVSAAGRVAWSMRSTLVLSMAIGLASALAGLTISYYADLPPGGTIVLVAAGVYLGSSRGWRCAEGARRPRAPRRRRARGSRGSAPRTARPPRRRRCRPEYGAGAPSTSRCVVVAGPPQRWHTAWSLSTNSACERSSGIGPNGSRRKSWSSPATTTRTPRSARSSARRDDSLTEELGLVDPHDVEALRLRRDLRDRGDRDGLHPRARMADDVRRVVAIVDPRLEDDDALSGDLGPAQPPDHLLALAAEHRPADDLEPATSLRRDPDHGGDPREAVGGHSGWREEALRALATLSPARRRSSVG